MNSNAQISGELNPLVPRITKIDDAVVSDNPSFAVLALLAPELADMLKADTYRRLQLHGIVISYRASLYELASRMYECHNLNLSEVLSIDFKAFTVKFDALKLQHAEISRVYQLFCDGLNKVNKRLDEKDYKIGLIYAELSRHLYDHTQYMDLLYSLSSASSKKSEPRPAINPSEIDQDPAVPFRTVMTAIIKTPMDEQLARQAGHGSTLTQPPGPTYNASHVDKDKFNKWLVANPAPRKPTYKVMRPFNAEESKTPVKSEETPFGCIECGSISVDDKLLYCNNCLAKACKECGGTDTSGECILCK